MREWLVRLDSTKAFCEWSWYRSCCYCCCCCC